MTVEPTRTEQLSPRSGAADRDPSTSLRGCHRILLVGRTGSGKTTLGRQLAAVLEVPHVELDSLYFRPDLTTVPREVLRRRTVDAVAGDAWVTDGNKSSVRDLVWPRADTVVWLDYRLGVSLWRLGKRALWRTSVIKEQTSKGGHGGHGGHGGEGGAAFATQMWSAAKGVSTALRSHRGQRRLFPTLLAEPEHRHLTVVRLRSPRATRRWLATVSAAAQRDASAR